MENNIQPYTLILNSFGFSCHLIKSLDMEEDFNQNVMNKHKF
jgi:hypothetical protein